MVYCNVRKKLLSVKALEGADKGRVIAYVERLQMKDAEFKVSEAGRSRVVKTKRKSVHAGIVGEIEALWGATLRGELDNSTIKGLAVGKPFKPLTGEPVFYNPYEVATFVRTSDRTPVSRAQRVELERCTVMAVGLQ